MVWMVVGIYWLKFMLEIILKSNKKQNNRYVKIDIIGEKSKIKGIE